MSQFDYGKIREAEILEELETIRSYERLEDSFTWTPE